MYRSGASIAAVADEGVLANRISLKGECLRPPQIGNRVGGDRAGKTQGNDFVRGKRPVSQLPMDD